MKILFLDIDGVLNSKQAFKFWHHHRDQKRWENGLEHYKGTLFQYLAQEFCPICLSNLEWIMREVEDLRIVVSSTWRLGKTVEMLKEIFEFSPIIANAILDKTPRLEDRIRGHEIQEWLDEQAFARIEKFVIVDDDSDMDHLMDRLVKTDNNVGLDYNKAREIIDRFNGRANRKNF